MRRPGPDSASEAELLWRTAEAPAFNLERSSEAGLCQELPQKREPRLCNPPMPLIWDHHLV